ncbi:MAG: AtpZ/AtpI family protein [Dehalococcoidia bacterium]|nr:AtpZ/AtpI family protein [Dehalococcoidia bacterium]
MVLSARPRTGGAGTGKIWGSPAFAFVGIGWFLATAILVPTGLGVWADRSWDTEPWFTLLGLSLGLAAGLRGAYQQLQEILRRQRSADDRARGGEKR